MEHQFNKKSMTAAEVCQRLLLRVNKAESRADELARSPGMVCLPFSAHIVFPR